MGELRVNNVKASALRFWAFLGRHQLGLLLTGAVLLAFAMVSVALYMYERSDASRLDLSHPDYKQVRSQITTEKSSGLSGTGPINDSFLKDFEKKYNEQAKHATVVDAFSGDVLSDEALGIEE